MARTQPTEAQIAALITTALNGVSVAGGTLKAVQNGRSVVVTVHSDLVGAPTFSAVHVVVS